MKLEAIGANNPLDARVAPHFTSVRHDIAFDRVGKQRRQIGARQPHFTGAAICTERIAQHVDEDLRRSAVERSVQCRQRQRTPDSLNHVWRLSVLQQPVGDASIFANVPTHLFERAQQGDHRYTVTFAKAARKQECARQVPRRRQPCRLQIEAVGVVQLERPVFDRPLEWDFEQIEQRSRCRVSAEQQVLSVVEHVLLVIEQQRNSARASAEFVARFEQQYRGTMGRQFSRRRAAGPSRSDHGHCETHTAAHP